MDTLQWASVRVGGREKKEEGSAWSARLSAPARQKPARPLKEEPRMDTNNFFYREEGEERRGQCVDTLQWASVRVGSREEGEERRG